MKVETMVANSRSEWTEKTWQVTLNMFGHSDFKLILSTYYAQNDDARLVAEASKIDFGLGLPRTG